MRSMTKSPLQLAKLALSFGRQSLAPYSSPRSRKDFVQAQLFALLVLRQFFHSDYRKTVQIVAEWSDVREALELTKVPHFTTLQKAHQRLLKKGASIDSSIQSVIEPAAVA
jgi:hypothetical protein